MSNLDPRPPGPYDPRDPNSPLDPTELSKRNKYSLQWTNIIHQYNDPKPVINNAKPVSSVVSQPVTSLPTVKLKRRKPKIAPPQPPTGGKRHTRRKHKKSRKTHRRRK